MILRLALEAFLPSLHFDWLVPSLSSGKMTLKLLKCVFFRHPVRSNGFCYISTSPLRDPHFHGPSHKWLLSVMDKVTSLQRGGIYGCQRWEFLGTSFRNTCKWSPGHIRDSRMQNSQGQQWILIRLRYRIPLSHFPIWEPRAGFVGSLLSCTDDVAGTLLEHLLRDVAGVQWHQCCFRKLLTPTIMVFWRIKKSSNVEKPLYFGMSKIYRRWCWKSSLLPRWNKCDVNSSFGNGMGSNCVLTSESFAR